MNVFLKHVRRMRTGYGGTEILGRMGGWTVRWLCGWRGG